MSLRAAKGSVAISVNGKEIATPGQERRARDDSLTKKGVLMMAKDRHIYSEINNKTDMEKVLLAIRRDVDQAKSRAALTELYKRAGYLITLTHAPAWKEKFGREAMTLRKVGEEEFSKTARKINRRAKQIGVEADYDEKWGE